MRRRRIRPSLRIQLVLVLGALALALLATLFVSRNSLTEAEESVRNLTDVAVPETAATNEMEINARGTGVGVLRYLLTGNPGARARVRNDQADFARARAQYLRLAESDTEKRLANRLGPLYRAYRDLGERLMDTLDGQRKRFSGAGNESFRRDLAAFHRLGEEIDTILDDQVQRASQDGLEDAEAVAGQAAGLLRWTFVLVVLVTLLAGAGLPTILRRIATLMRRTKHQQVQEAAQQEIRERIGGTLASGGPDVVFQPIVDLRSGRVVGAEALSRFPTDPRLTPDRWFAEAWEVGLGEDLESAAVRAALASLERLPADVFLSVNLSPAALTSPGFRELRRGLPYSRLVVEMTEHAQVDDYEALRRPLQDLRRGGGRLAVDDVGAGFASLRHVLTLAPDIIKLDVELTRDIDTDPARHALASGLVALATELGATVVAEGIETKQQLDVLTSIGCAWGQGYYLGRPDRPAELDLARRAPTLAV